MLHLALGVFLHLAFVLLHEQIMFSCSSSSVCCVAIHHAASTDLLLD